MAGASLRAFISSCSPAFARAAISSHSMPQPAKSIFLQSGAYFIDPESLLHFQFRQSPFVPFRGFSKIDPENNGRLHVCQSSDSEAVGNVIATVTGDADVEICPSKGLEVDFGTESSDEEDRHFTASKGELQSGLYVVATPIGNLEDITLRALRVLKSADLILTEDTRHSAKLLQHYDIHTPTASYHKFNETSRQHFALERLKRGEVLALISDAGMPGISDPGADLVMTCVEAKVRVFPIPGPSAVITALVAAGLSTTEFSFVGFLSAQESLRQKRLMVASSETATQVIYVPPHKLSRVLEDCIVAFGSSRRCVVAREMTKIHEEFWRGTLGEADAEFSSRNPRGEITLVIEGLQSSDVKLPTDEELESELQTAMTNGISVSEAAKFVAHKTSTRKKKVYELALKLSGRMHIGENN